MFGLVLPKLFGETCSLCGQRTHDLVRHFVTVHHGLGLEPPLGSARSRRRPEGPCV
jgi:hypothetical protein